MKDEMASDDRRTKKKVKVAVIAMGRGGGGGGGGVFFLYFEMDLVDFCGEVVSLTGILVFVLGAIAVSERSQKLNGGYDDVWL